MSENTESHKNKHSQPALQFARNSKLTDSTIAKVILSFVAVGIYVIIGVPIVDKHIGPRTIEQCHAGNSFLTHCIGANLSASGMGALETPNCSKK